MFNAYLQGKSIWDAFNAIFGWLDPTISITIALVIGFLAFIAIKRIIV